MLEIVEENNVLTINVEADSTLIAKSNVAYVALSSNDREAKLMVESSVH